MENLICGDDLRPPHINIGFLDVYCPDRAWGHHSRFLQCFELYWSSFLSFRFVSFNIDTTRGRKWRRELYDIVRGGIRNVWHKSVTKSTMLFQISSTFTFFSRIFNHHQHLAMFFIIIDITIITGINFLNRPSSALRQLPNKMSIILCTNKTETMQTFVQKYSSKASVLVFLEHPTEENILKHRLQELKCLFAKVYLPPP